MKQQISRDLFVVILVHPFILLFITKLTTAIFCKVFYSKGGPNCFRLFLCQYFSVLLKITMLAKKRDKYFPYQTSYSFRKISVSEKRDYEKMEADIQKLTQQVHQNQQKIKQLKTQIRYLKERRNFLGGKDYKCYEGEVISCRLAALSLSYEQRKQKIEAENEEMMKKYIVDTKQMMELKTSEEALKQQNKRLIKFIFDERERRMSQTDISCRCSILKEKLEEKKIRIKQLEKEKKKLEEQNKKLRAQIDGTQKKQVIRKKRVSRLVLLNYTNPY